VPLLTTVTLADRVGAGPEYLITALTVGTFGWAAFGWAAAARRRRAAAGPIATQA